MRLPASWALLLGIGVNKMPSVSKKQHNLMAMVAHDPKAAKRLKIPQSVGKEFTKADKGRTFKSGGTVDGCCSRGKTKGRMV